MSSPRRPRITCPHCQRQVSASWSTGTVYPHGPAGGKCAGSGTAVDLYTKES